jgi:DNA topoisomerase VI subunit B
MSTHKPPASTSNKTDPRAASAVTAVEMGARQREISVSEFFTKNRHLLGFDNPRKALLTCAKEAVDNALDACEEAGILPEVTVQRKSWLSDLQLHSPQVRRHAFE